MSFNKRYIDNSQVLRLFKDGGLQKVVNWYTKGVDAVITEVGLSSDIYDIIYGADWDCIDGFTREDNMRKRIHEELGIDEDKK